MTINVTGQKHLIGMREILVLGPQPKKEFLHPILYAPDHSKKRGFWYCEDCNKACIANSDFSHQEGCIKSVLSYGFGPQEDISRSPLPPQFAAELFALAMATIETERVTSKLRKLKSSGVKSPVIRFQRGCTGEFLMHYYKDPPQSPKGIDSDKTLLTKDDNKSLP